MSYVSVLQTLLSPLSDVPRPTEVNSLSSEGVRFISCGDSHTAVLNQVKGNHACACAEMWLVCVICRCLHSDALALYLMIMPPDYTVDLGYLVHTCMSVGSTTATCELNNGFEYITNSAPNYDLLD